MRGKICADAAKNLSLVRRGVTKNRACAAGLAKVAHDASVDSRDKNACHSIALIMPFITTE